MASETLFPEEVTANAQIIGCDMSDIHATAPVKLFTATQDQQSWHATNLVGVASVFFDMDIKVPILRVVDIVNKKILLEEECYDTFEMQKLTDKFYSAEFENVMVGFLFAEGFDAFAFYKKVVGVCNIAKQAAKAAGLTGGSTAASNAPATKISTKTTTAKDSSSGSGSGGGFLSKVGGLFGRGGAKEEKKQEARPRPKIGAVKTFTHVSHMGYDAKSGFGQIPDEWLNVFKMAGISEEQLKDKKTADFLVKTVVAAERAKRAPPPPPPQAGGAGAGAPPPPPPHHAHSGSAVPPPPSKAGGAPPPPPPPPPPMAAAAPGGAPASVGKGAPPPPPPPPPPMAVSDSGSGGGGDFLSQIKNTKLKAISDRDIPEVAKMDADEQQDLASKIRMALMARREAVADDDDDEDDTDWDM